MSEIKFPVYVWCEDCESSIDVGAVESADGGFEIIIKGCRQCLKDLDACAFEAGYNRGFDDAENRRGYSMKYDWTERLE